MVSLENYIGLVDQQNNINNPRFSESAHLETKILIIKLKKLVRKLYMKLSKSLCSVIQQCQVTKFLFLCILL